MRGVSIIGIGSTNFGLLGEMTLEEMAVRACNEAISDAGIEKKDIEAFFLGNYISGMLLGQETLAPMVAYSLGLNGNVAATKVEGACCSSSIGLRLGYLLIASGVHDIVLLAGAEKMTSESTPRVTRALAAAMDPVSEWRTGFTYPGFFGLVANRYMHEYKATIEQIGMVSVKNHNNSVSNPRARFRKPVTLDEVLNSRLVADPLKLYDCCPISDGAAAMVLCASDRAKEYTNKLVEIIGSGMASGLRTTHETINDTDTILSLPATLMAAKQAFEMAKLTPSDIDVIELHDCFTMAEIVDSEDLGFFKKGTGARAVEEGLTQVNGKIPINPSGGLLSKGHPVGATGCGQAFEIVKQLRGEHENQVKNSEVGLTHNSGGTGAVCTVHIFRRSF
jgi:acetyl-CoA C-acetyltransferase